MAEQRACDVEPGSEGVNHDGVVAAGVASGQVLATAGQDLRLSAIMSGHKLTSHQIWPYSGLLHHH